MDIPRIFNITESAHRIHNPLTRDKLASLGEALRLEQGTRDIGHPLADQFPVRAEVLPGLGRHCLGDGNGFHEADQGNGDHGAEQVHDGVADAGRARGWGTAAPDHHRRE